VELAEFLALPRVTSAACSPDGSWLAVSVQRLDADGAKFISDIWRAPTDGSTPTLLLEGEHSDRAPSFRDDGALGFLSDRPVEGEEEPERSQVWLWSDGALSMLSDEPVGVTSFAFSGPRLVLLSSHRPGVPLSE
jgi:dipeptidyl aminopeptidase/acylaminoacyl peptidase